MKIPSRLPKHWIPPPLPLPAEATLVHTRFPLSRSGIPRRLAAVWFLSRWALSRSITKKFDSAGAHHGLYHLTAAARYLNLAWVETIRQLTLRESPLTGVPERYLRQTPAGPVSLDQVRWTIESELQCPLEHTFVSLDPIPVFTDAYSQTHKAHLTWGGEEVFVRVLHPGVCKQIDEDLRYIRIAIRFLKLTRIGKNLDARNLLKDLHERLHQETDFRYQARDMRLLRTSLYSHGVYIPRVYEQYSTQRICVTECVPGLPLTHFLDFQRRFPEISRHWSRSHRVLPASAGKRILFAFYAAVADNGLLQEEVDSNMILLLAGGRVCITGPCHVLFLESEFRRNFLRKLAALMAGEIQTAAELTLLSCERGILSDAGRAVRWMSQIYRRWERENLLPKDMAHAPLLSAIERECAYAAYRIGFSPSLEWLRVLQSWSQHDHLLRLMLNNPYQRKLLERFLKYHEKNRDFDGETQPKEKRTVAETVSVFLAQMSQLEEVERQKQVDHVGTE
ncbi:MAG: hypothetical protein JO028_02660 [Acidobacteriaceae bacterium]|nr:hypothetical protein [Acidobacteriaceae bacterium]